MLASSIKLGFRAMPSCIITIWQKTRLKPKHTNGSVVMKTQKPIYGCTPCGLWQHAIPQTHLLWPAVFLSSLTQKAAHYAVCTEKKIQLL